MTSGTTDDADRDRRIGEVIAAYTEALDAGTAPDREALLRQHPDLAGDLAEYFAQYDRFQQFAEPFRPLASADPAVPTTQPDTEGTAEYKTPRSDPEPPGAGPGPAPPAGPPPLDDLPDIDDGDGDGNGDGGGPDQPRGARIRYFGDYEVHRVLGWGGMGVVYKARQRSLNRFVALKMLGAGLWASEEDLRRFRNEVEAVASLDHPHIVPIYEVGEYDHRRYFAMKLVEGASLAHKLTTAPLDPHAAALLTAVVARAVHHAHMRGILHRDLKPANILLDSTGAPHVSDFGLARRIEGGDEHSVSGSILGTPSYMAPEQAQGLRAAISTATDVYGIGTVFYTALTARPPFRDESVIETLRQVRKQAPQRPSQVNRRVPRDLETICLKCLEKDPRKRYDSAAALADDLERYLRGEPILARRTGSAERLIKWARRRPALAGLTAALLVTLVLGTAGIAWNWREAVQQRNLKEQQRLAAVAAERKAEAEKAKAETEKAKALAVNQFLTKKLLSQADPESNPYSAKVTLLEVLDRAAVQVSGSFVGQPEVEAAIQTTIGETYSGLGESAKCEDHTRRALKLLELSVGPEHPETLKALNFLVGTLWWEGKRVEAEPLARRNLEACRRVLGLAHLETLRATSNLALLLMHHLSTRDAAEAMFKETYETHQRVLGPDHEDTIGVARWLAAALRDSGRWEEAVAVHRDRIAALTRSLGPDKVKTQQATRDLARVLNANGRSREAEGILRPAVAIMRRILGPEHSETLATLGQLREAVAAQGHSVEEEALLRELIAAGRNKSREPTPDGRMMGLDGLNNALGDLGSLLARLDRPGEAEPLLVESLAVARSQKAVNVARADSAERSLAEFLANRRQSLSDQARFLMNQNRHGEAEPLLLEAFRLTQVSRENLVPRPISEQSIQRLAQATIELLIQLYERWGKPEQAAAWRLNWLDAGFPSNPFASPPSDSTGVKGALRSAPSGWTLTGVGLRDVEIGLDREVKHSGSASLRMQVGGRQERIEIRRIRQAFRADEFRGKRLRLSGYVKGEEATEDVGIWINIGDKERTGLALDNTAYRQRKGTKGWQRHEIVLDVPDSAEEIALGFLMTGTGRAWVDDFELEVVDKTVVTTGRPDVPRARTTPLNPGLPRGPQNLGFED